MTRPQQIARVLPPSPPYALATPVFRFRALASLAGRAPLGGEREVALACYMAARLAQDSVVGPVLPDSVREARAQGARHWLAAMTLPAAMRVPLARLVEATAGGDRATVRTALQAVTDVTASQLDSAAHSELLQLAQAVAV
ncbi:MAG: hypothetical protein JWO05_634 [Gemmatimonadetes bacterium]|nr:hypothetical protein [Gemmatimonadota bacterium]